MTDLSHWNFAEQFTVNEAAALIEGIDPREASGGSPIATRINEATIKAFIAVARGEPLPPDGLLTKELALTMHPDFVPSFFLDKTGSTLHGIETIDRAEIVRWLAAIGTKSVYQFTPAQTATPAPESMELDYSLLATRENLLDAFQKWGLKPAWFDDLHGHQWLLDARRIRGQGQRGNIIEPMFCPFIVMQGLVEKVRKQSRINRDTAWRVLEHKFPNVYAEHVDYDPRERTGY